MRMPPNTKKVKLQMLLKMRLRSVTPERSSSVGFPQFHLAITPLVQITSCQPGDVLATAVDFPFKHSYEEFITLNTRRKHL